MSTEDPSAPTEHRSEARAQARADLSREIHLATTTLDGDQAALAIEALIEVMLDEREAARAKEHQP